MQEVLSKSWLYYHYGNINRIFVMQFLQRGQQTEPTGLKNICTGAVTHVLMITCKTSFKVPLKDLQRGNSNAFMQKEETPE